MKSNKEYLVSNEIVAKSFGITTQTIYDWTNNENFPVHSVGNNNEKNLYDLPKCIEWYRNREVSKAVGGNIGHEKFRVMRATADKLELEVAEKQGKLVKYDDVLEVWCNTFANIRNALMNIPKQFGQIWAGIESRYVAEEELEKTIRQILEDSTDVRH